MSVAPLLRAVEEAHLTQSDVRWSPRHRECACEGRRGWPGAHPGLRGNHHPLHGESVNRVFTVRRLAHNVGVEHTSCCTRPALTRSRSCATTRCAAEPVLHASGCAARPPASRSAATRSRWLFAPEQDARHTRDQHAPLETPGCNRLSPSCRFPARPHTIWTGRHPPPPDPLPAARREEGTRKCSPLPLCGGGTWGWGCGREEAGRSWRTLATWRRRLARRNWRPRWRRSKRDCARSCAGWARCWSPTLAAWIARCC